MDSHLKKAKIYAKEDIITDTIDTMHNCYNDLKNIWNENAKEVDEDKLKIIYSIFSVFLLGFLFSQGLFYVWSFNKEEYIQESLNPFNDTILFKDKDTLIDYAGIENGAEILEEFSVAEYLGWFAVLSYNKREAVISSDNRPGRCWAFEGGYGHVGIKLFDTIKPKYFTIRHLNTVNYENAPRNFRVYNLDYFGRSVLMGSYSLNMRIEDEHRKAWERFKCEDFCDGNLEFVLLEVIDNYGAEKTCVYQFEVHGVPAE